MRGMQVETLFRLGGDDADRKLEAAQELAGRLSQVECPWHSRNAVVAALPAEGGDVRWTIEDVCCEDFGRELNKLIEKAMREWQA